MPDKLHTLNNRGAWGQTEAHRLVLDENYCNGSLRADAILPSDDGGSTLFRNDAQLKPCNKFHQQRYAATAHPKEVEAAKKSAAMRIFECDAEACSLWAMEERNQKPRARPVTRKVSHTYVSLKGKCEKN